MSLINEYRATEEAIKELQERLKSLSEDDKLKKELEFEGKLRELMNTRSRCATSSPCSIRMPPATAKLHVRRKRPPASAHVASSSTRTRTAVK